ncbi:MAG TPA: thioesterase domain-containing protein [Steroidobacteraceae bacterium]|jgi:thioesterase domain-containing protein/acyl carrier protein
MKRANEVDVTGPDPVLLKQLQQLWMQALDTTQCDFADSWEEAGGDSLATLQLLLHIELAFARTLSYEELAPDMHVQDLTALLMRAALTPVADLPRVHLVPGMFGDEPRLAILRRALADSIRFNLVELPGMMESAAMLRDIARTGAYVARAIQQQQPSGPILLAGFSFGACVAYEAAQVLTAAGREIGLLGLFDGPLGLAANGKKRPLWRWFGPYTVLLSATRWAASWNAGRRALLWLLQRCGLAPWLAVYKFLCVAYRQQATEFWSPTSLNVNTWLAVSAELAPITLAAWRRLCARLRVVSLPGKHLDIFYTPAADMLIPAFRGAVDAVHAKLRRRAAQADLPPGLPAVAAVAP